MLAAYGPVGASLSIDLWVNARSEDKARLGAGSNRGGGISVATLAYDARGLLSQTARTGGPTIARTYDGDRRLTQTVDGTATSHLAWDPTMYDRNDEG